MKRKPLVIDVSGSGFYLLQMFLPLGKVNIVHIKSTPILASVIGAKPSSIIVVPEPTELPRISVANAMLVVKPVRAM